MNFDRLRLVADLANFGLRTEAMLVVSIPENPGEFLTFIETILDSEDGPKITVSEFKYRYSVDRPAKILFSLSTETPAVIESAVERLTVAGYQCQNVTDSSAVQLHLRHMVGGRPRSYSGCIEHEKIVVVRTSSYCRLDAFPFHRVWNVYG
jgi:threonine dehydratase